MKGEVSKRPDLFGAGILLISSPENILKKVKGEDLGLL
jgi:hypothetical protein